MSDDGNRQVALTVERLAVELGLSPEQFKALLDLGAQQDLNLDGINGAINKLAENVSEPDTSVAAEIASLKQEMAVGFAGVNQSIANLNNTIFDRSVDLAKWLAAIALAAANPADNTTEIQALIDKNAADVRTAKEKLQSSIDRNQP